MKHKIITVEIADPQFGVYRFGTYKCFNQNDTLVALAACDLHSERDRSPNQIMRVHVYNANLPALVPANKNFPWAVTKKPLDTPKFSWNTSSMLDKVPNEFRGLFHDLELIP